MLHIISRSPFTSDALTSCLRLAQPGSVILLIEDGVLAAIKNSKISAVITEAAARYDVYALQADLEARGIKENVVADIQLVDYAGFVDLVAQHNPIQNWN